MDRIDIISPRPLQISLQECHSQMIALLMSKNPYFLLLSGWQADAEGTLPLHLKMCFRYATGSSFIDFNFVLLKCNDGHFLHCSRNVTKLIAKFPVVNANIEMWLIWWKRIWGSFPLLVNFDSVPFLHCIKSVCSNRHLENTNFLVLPSIRFAIILMDFILCTLKPFVLI
jgi:hypothetical protein